MGTDVFPAPLFGTNPCIWPVGLKKRSWVF